MTEHRTFDTGPWRLCEEGDGRTIEARAVPYSTPTRIGTVWEQVSPGAVDVPALVGVPLLWRHDEPIGVVQAATDDPAGPLVRARVSNTPRGHEALELVSDGAVRGVSIGFDPVLADRDADTVTHTLIDIREVSLTPLPAYRDAAVLSLREGNTMTDTMQAAPVPADAPADHGRQLDLTPADVRELRERLAAVEVDHAARDTTHPLAAYRTFAEYAMAVKAGTEKRDWIEQVTTNNPGVIAPAWVGEVRGILSQTRTLVEATGGPQAAPATGLSFYFPYFDGTLTDLVGVQAAELDAVTSARVDIKRGTVDFATYAGGSALSLQIIERSEPSYVDAYLRIMAAAFGVVTEKAYQVAALDAADAGSALTLTGTSGSLDADVFALRAWLATATMAVEDATGQPGTVLALADDLYLTVANLLIHPDTGFFVEQNRPRIVRARHLGRGEGFLTNGAAVRWVEDGPRVINDDLVSQLGRDVAIYGFGATAAYTPSGIYSVAAIES